MSKKKTTGNAGKRKHEMGSAPNGSSQLSAGGVLHQIELVPLKVIGRRVLDRWPDNFFAETKQVAYCPGNIVPGIDFSNDPLLQGH